jgi:hypothetical protein
MTTKVVNIGPRPHVTVMAPQRMNPAIRLGHCGECGATTYVVPLQRVNDPIGAVACFDCLPCVKTDRADIA